MKKSEIMFGLLRIPVDLFMIAFAFLSAFYLRKQTLILPNVFVEADLTTFPTPIIYTKLVSLFGIAFILLLLISGSYSLRVYNTYSREAKTILVAWFIWIGTILLYYFLLRDFPFSRLVIVLGWSFSLIYVLLGRGLVKSLQIIALTLNIGVRRVAFIGQSFLSEKMIETLKKRKEYQILGHIGTNTSNTISNLKSLGSLAKLKSIIDENKIEEIIQLEYLGESNMEIISICREKHVQYHFIPDNEGLQTMRIDLQLIGDYPLVSLKITPLDGWGKVIKRIFDIIFSSMMLILTSPIILIAAVLIKIDSKGPIFFTKLDNGDPVLRVGEKGELFKFYKLRTMYDKTHSLRYNELASKNKRNGPVVKIANDPRITRIGKFLRKFDIDELPQFYNVLNGEMSVVGPRPHLPEEVKRYNSNHKFALSIKPGITGLAQVNGRSRIDFDTESNLDTFYIENWSIWLDIKICFKTFFTILNGRGE